jgi:uncharacterized NAD(P)/FAD-binding protein YdhS
LASRSSRRLRAGSTIASRTCAPWHETAGAAGWGRASGVGAASIALIGAGPTSIYTLQALLARAAGPLSITIFEEQARAGLGTPYRPGWNDPAMLANIASIELPPVGMTLVEWLARQAPERLAGYNIDPDGIDERTFYPRVVLGHYLRDRFEALVAEGVRPAMRSTSVSGRG